MVRDRVGGVPLHAIEATCFVHTGIAQALDEASQPWGIRVFRYEIADIHVDRGTREAMEKQCGRRVKTLLDAIDATCSVST